MAHRKKTHDHPVPPANQPQAGPPEDASAERPAAVIRMHMWESVIEMMQAAMDPVPLYEDEPGLEERMREVVGAMED